MCQELNEWLQKSWCVRAALALLARGSIVRGFSLAWLTTGQQLGGVRCSPVRRPKRQGLAWFALRSTTSKKAVVLSSTLSPSTSQNGVGESSCNDLSPLSVAQTTVISRFAKTSCFKDTQSSDERCGLPYRNSHRRNLLQNKSDATFIVNVSFQTSASELDSAFLFDFLNLFIFFSRLIFLLFRSQFFHQIVCWVFY